MSELNQFYKTVLSLANLIPDDKGYIRASTKDKHFLSVENRLWVLPTQEHLKTLTPDKEVFHPLSENTILRLSKTMEVFMYRVNGALNTRFAELAFGLKTFCGSPAKQANITQAQLKVVRNIEYEEEVNKDYSTVDPFLTFLLNQVVKNPSETFVNISLARGGFYKGVKKSRVGIVTFPFYKKLKEAEDKTKKESEIQNLTKKQIKLLIQIYEAIFPGLEIPEEYNYPCEGGAAPFFVTLMQTAAGLADAMNVVLEAFQNEDCFSELEVINLSWQSVLQNPAEMSRLARHAPNTELEQVPESQTRVPQGNFTTNPPPPVAVPETAAVQGPEIPYAGPVANVPQNAQQFQQVQNQSGMSGRKPPGRERVPYEDWAKKSAQPSQMGVNASIASSVQRYNQAYEQYYNGHMRQYGVAPANMPHPSSIPRGMLAPYFHGAPPMPQMPQGPQVGYPQQQMPMNAWGQPVQQQMPMNAWGQPMQPQMPMNAWGQPTQMQQPMNAWGQPIQAQMPMNAWMGSTYPNAQPQQQQPQVSWGNNQNTGGNIIPGTM